MPVRRRNASKVPLRRSKMPDITVWGARTTRSDILEMACEELGLEYKFVALDWNAKEHKSPEYLKVRVCECQSQTHRRGAIGGADCAVVGRE